MATAEAGELGELGLASRPAPRRAVTAQGHPRRIFATAIERGNVVAAEATARDLGRQSFESESVRAAAKLLTELARG